MTIACEIFEEIIFGLCRELNLQCRIYPNLYMHPTAHIQVYRGYITIFMTNQEMRVLAPLCTNIAHLADPEVINHIRDFLKKYKQKFIESATIRNNP